MHVSWQITARVIAGAVALASAFAFMAHGAAFSNSSQLVQEPADVRRAHAYAAEGLRGAARVSGTASMTVTAFASSPLSVGQLAAFSRVIIIGTPVHNVSRLTTNALSIEMEMRVVVQEALKGANEIDQEVTVLLQGGRVGFGDGSFAQINVVGLKRPVKDRQYLICLRSAIDRTGDRALYVPAFGAMGIYDITDRQAAVRPAGPETMTFARWLREDKISSSRFVEQIREAIR